MPRVYLTIALLLAAACARAEGLPDLGDVSQSIISPRQERALGENIMREVRAGRDYLDDAEIVDYLNELGYRLVSNSPDFRQPFEFFLIRDGTVNAFALPGGFIGVHTGLLLTAQSEAELAAVLAHEIAHVTQKHLARMITGQQQSALTSLAAVAVAILAARSNAQVSQAALATAQAASVQSQLDFTRENEREADRIGLQILEKSGFDVRAMPAFLERLQKAGRISEGGAPSYLRTHPLTFERIADVQNRTQGMTYRQSPDSIEFQMLRARLRAAQETPQEAVAFFESGLREKKFLAGAAARYGLVAALLRARDYPRAAVEMAALHKTVPASPIVAALAGRLKSAEGDAAAALDFYRQALASHPHYRALVYDYADALLQNQRSGEALRLLDEQLQLFPEDYRLYLLQAKSHAARGEKLSQHRAQAEAYVRMGNLPAAIEQLQIALAGGKGDFYQLSGIEARLRELQARDRENQKP